MCVCSLFTNLATSLLVRHMKSTDAYQSFFPSFLWLLRDAFLDVSTEYLKAEVLRVQKPGNMEAAVQRTLTQFFFNFECKTLPLPSTSIKVMTNVSKNQKELDPSFNKGVNELITFLKANVEPKRVFDSYTARATCDGPTLAALVQEVAKAISYHDSIPALDKTWKQVVESRCNAVQEKLLAEYCTTIKARYDRASKGNPLDEVDNSQNKLSPSVMKIHQHLCTEIMTKLSNELEPLLSSHTIELTQELVAEKFEKKLVQYQMEIDPYTQVSVKKIVGGAIFPIVEENRRRSRNFCNDLFNDLYTPIRERVKAGDDRYTTERLASDIETLLQEYDRKSVGPEKWHIRTKMETTIKQNNKLFQKHLQVLKHAEKERQMQESLQKLLLQSLNESRRQLDEKLTEFAKNQQEVQEKRLEVKKLKEKIKELEQEKKEMSEIEAKRRLEESQQLACEGFRREVAEIKLKQMEDALQKFKEEIAKQTPKLNEGFSKESKQLQVKLLGSTEAVIKDFEKTLHEYIMFAKLQLQSLIESRRQLDEKLTECARNQQEVQEKGLEVKKLKEKIKELEQEKKDMSEIEAKRRLEESQQLALERSSRETAENKLKQKEATLQKFLKGIAKRKCT